MTKQDEIREGISGILGILYNFHLDRDAYTDRIIRYLNDNGCVLKAERESDRCELCECGSFTATEPLIEGKK